MEKIAWRNLGDFCLAVFWRFYEERGLQTAGSLTYTTLLSLVPLFTVALAVSTAFPVFDQTMAALQAFVLQNFLPDARGIETIAEQITSFTRNAGRLTAIGLGARLLQRPELGALLGAILVATFFTIITDQFGTLAGAARWLSR